VINNMRLALAQIDTVVGGVDHNLRAVREFLGKAREAKADLVAFPEMTLTGYPLLDLVFRESLLKDQRRALEEAAAETSGLTAVIGFIDVDAGQRTREGRPVIYNAAGVVRDGQLIAVHRKILLPGYDVFFEGRYFTPGTEATLVDVAGQKVGVQVCEDLWDTHDAQKVTRRQASAGARLIVNISASPFHVGKGQTRRELLARHVQQSRIPIAYVNQVGGEDGYEGELVFDGESLVLGADGSLLARGTQFEQELVVCDIDLETGTGAAVADRAISDDDEAHRALVCGVRDYAIRSGFGKGLLGLSGGIDSVLVVAIAVQVLGPQHVLGVSMPSRYSSEHSKSDAAELARNLGIEFTTIPIESVFESYLGALEEHFEGVEPDVTEENLQARIRGGLLMALSNKFGSLLLSTGNKTEVALGYCTLYGDMNGGLMALADVSKRRVYSISRHINAVAGRELIPISSIEKPPSAELRDEQVDPFDYDVVSPLTNLLVEDELEADEVIARGYDQELVRRLDRLVRLSEYKRRQAAPGIRITEKAFGVGRRMPISYPGR